MSQKLNQTQYSEAVNYTFNHFDQDRDNRLNKAEFNKMFSAISNSLDFTLTTQILDYLFGRFDRDQDGFVTEADLKPVLTKAYYA